MEFLSVLFTASEEPQPKLTEIVNGEQRCTETWWFPKKMAIEIASFPIKNGDFP